MEMEYFCLWLVFIHIGSILSIFPCLLIICFLCFFFETRLMVYFRLAQNSSQTNVHLATMPLLLDFCFLLNSFFLVFQKVIRMFLFCFCCCVQDANPLFVLNALFSQPSLWYFCCIQGTNFVRLIYFILSFFDLESCLQM